MGFPIVTGFLCLDIDAVLPIKISYAVNTRLITVSPRLDIDTSLTIKVTFAINA